MFQGLFLSCNFIKTVILTQGFFCEICKIFRNTFFTEHLFMTAFILQQLLALYIAGNFQVWEVISREKIDPRISRILQI